MRDLRNLPDPVRERLDDELVDEVSARVRRGDYAEARHPFRGLELRQIDGDSNPTLDGYATVYESWYDVLGGPSNGYGWREMIATGAASKSVSEKDDVRLLVNHDGLPLARTRSGTLRLESDSIGLRSEAELDRLSPAVASVVSAMERGDADEMSLAFRAIRQEWNDDYTERIIREMELFDVSIVTYPANPATVAQLRTLSTGSPTSTIAITSNNSAPTLIESLSDPELLAADRRGLDVETARRAVEALRGRRR